MPVFHKSRIVVSSDVPLESATDQALQCTDTLRVFVPLLCFSCACTLLSCPDGRVHIYYLHEMLRISYCIYCNVKQLTYGDTDVRNTVSA